MAPHAGLVFSQSSKRHAGAATGVPRRGLSLRKCRQMSVPLRPAAVCRVRFVHAAATSAHMAVPVASHARAPQQQHPGLRHAHSVDIAGSKASEESTSQLEAQVAASSAPLMQLRQHHLQQMQQQLLFQQQKQQQGTKSHVLPIASAAVLLVGAATAMFRSRQQQQQQQQQPLRHQQELSQSMQQHVQTALAAVQCAASGTAAATRRWVTDKSGAAAGRLQDAMSAGRNKISTHQQPLVPQKKEQQQRQQQQQQMQARVEPKHLPPDWWRSLAEVYYVSFGLSAGLVPMVELPSYKTAGSLQEPASLADATAQEQSTEFLVAFEAEADADYACNALQESFIASAVHNRKPLDQARRMFKGAVVKAKPWYLEDLAAVQQACLLVLPRGRLQHGRTMTGPQLQDFLVQQLTPSSHPGATSDEVQQQQQQPPVYQHQPDRILEQNISQQQQLENQEPSQHVDEDCSTAVTPLSSSSTSSGAKQPVAGPFVPVSTDLPFFDFDAASTTVVQAPGSSAVSALTNLMAAGAAAVPRDLLGSRSTSQPSSSSSTVEESNMAAQHGSNSSQIGLPPVQLPEQVPLEAVVMGGGGSSSSEEAPAPSNVWDASAAAAHPAEDVTQVLEPSVSAAAADAYQAASRSTQTAAAGAVGGVAEAAVDQEAALQSTGGVRGTLAAAPHLGMPSETSLAGMTPAAAAAAGWDVGQGQVQAGAPSTTALQEQTDATAAQNEQAADDQEDLLAQYYSLRQQQQPLSAEQLEIAYQQAAAQAAAAAGGSSIDMSDTTLSPTAVAAAAAAAGIGVDGSDLADAVAAKFFKKERSSSSRNSSGNVIGNSEAAMMAAKAAAVPVLADAEPAAANAISTMQQQLDHLQRQANVLLQQRQQQQQQQQQHQKQQQNSKPAQINKELLQKLSQEITKVQQQMQQVAAEIGVEQHQGSSNIGGSSSGSLSDGPAAMVEDSQQQFQVTSKHTSSIDNTDFVVQAEPLPSTTSSSPFEQPAAGTAPGAKAAGNGVTGGDGIVSAASTGSSSSSSSSSNRSWGAWGTNTRIKAANVTLLKDSNLPVAMTTQQQQQQQPQLPSSSNRSGDKPAGHHDQDTAAATVTDDGATIVSRKFGVKRPKKVKRDPLERQFIVKDALRAAAKQMSPDASEQAADELDDEQRRQQQQQQLGHDSRNGSSNGRRWWQDQFQALYLPSIRHADGSVGFVQMDVSLNPDEKDVRVLTFEDRHDCMKCLAVLRLWPGMTNAQLSMGAMSSGVVEQEIRDSYLQQLAMTGGDAAAVGASLPSGIVVFRRGKLPLRVGMDREQFTQVVVFQAAAQLALSNMGYQFDDA